MTVFPQRRRWAPAIAGALVLVVAVTATRQVSARALHEAEADLLASRAATVTELAPKTAVSQDAEEVAGLVDLAGFTPGDPAANQLGLQRLQVASTGDRPSLVALLDVDGLPLASSSPDAALDPNRFGPAWEDAGRGQRAITDAFRYRDAVSTATLLPVRLPDGRTWAVLVLVQSALDSTHQALQRNIGSLNDRPGGLVLVDRAGTVVNSWDPDDVGEREHATRRAARRLHALLGNCRDIVLVVAPDRRLMFVSPAAGPLLGRDPAGGTSPTIAALCHPDDADAVTALLDDPASGPLTDVRLRRGEGGGGTGADRYGWFDIEATDLHDHPEIGGTLLTCHEVSERKDLADQLTVRASYDGLTGLPNRVELGLHLDRLTDGRRLQQPLALLYVDLDHFKPVNDGLGHEAGDEVLRTIADRFHAAAGPGALVFRLGGDEFAVALDDADADDALTAARRLRDAAREPIAVGDAHARLDASIGIAVAAADTDLDNPELLVRRADQAMYQAKQSGRGRITLARAPAGGPGATGPDPSPPGQVERRRSSRPAAPPVAVDAPDPAPPAPAGRARRRSPGVASRPGSLLSLVLSVAVVAGIAAVGHAQDTATQQAAEQRRLDDVRAVTERSSEYYGHQFDPQRLVDLLAALPWRLDGSAADAAIAEGIAGVFITGAQADALLARPDGTVLLPAGGRPPIPPQEQAWLAAARGAPTVEPLVMVAGQLRTYFLLPVLRDGRTAAVFTLGVPTRDSLLQQMIRQVGSLSSTGGWSLTDHRGRVFASFDPDLIGRQLGEPTGTAARGEAPGGNEAGGDRVIVRARLASMSTPDPVYLAFSDDAASFFGDLRGGVTVRDDGLLAVVVTAVAFLALAHHRREQAARRLRRRLDALLAHTHDIVAVLDRRGRATFVSSAVAGLLGRRAEDLLRRPWAELVHPDDATSLGPVERWTGRVAEVRLRHASGRYRWFDVDAVDRVDHPEIRGTLLTCHEIGERKAYQDQLAHRAEHDALTGLANRARFAFELERLAEDPDAQPFAVLFIDLDHFKPVNDTHGHDAGDAVLRAVADRLRHSVRAPGGLPDPADHAHDTVCRLGGDEFAVLLHDVTEHDARATAERILATVADPIVLAGDAAVTIGATIGVALSHPGREHPDRAVRNADLAMYQAKEAGRNRYALAPTA